MTAAKVAVVQQGAAANTAKLSYGMSQGFGEGSSSSSTGSSFTAARPAAKRCRLGDNMIEEAPLPPPAAAAAAVAEVAAS
jgi:hypothetical protein